MGVLSGALLIWSPLLSAHAGVRTPSAPAVGNTYGGVTPQDLPVIVDMNASRRQIVRTVTALELTCTSGGTAVVPDGYTSVFVTKKGKFRAAFGPVINRNDDGSTTDFQGKMSGALNAAKTKITGSWSMTATEHDATGNVTDTCTSGSVSWKAKQ
jgi:hypothetical protein